ncbi:MAG: hypothetical protein IJQ02_06135 [Oscillospiraceae bacterium]|nr:hypothetical protein [Oscillospiraceae bacterium]
MATNNRIRLLCAEADRESLQPLLDQLNAKGLHVKEKGGEPEKDDIVLAALSEAFYADSEKTGQLLSLIGAGAENVLPLQTDGAAMPETLKNVLYARNIIPAAERDAVQVAERVVAALPKKKNRLPLILSVAGVALLAVIGIFLWNSSRGEAPEPVATEEVTEEDPIVLPAGLTEEDLAQIVNVIIVGEQAEFYTAADVRKSGHIDWDYYAYRDYREDGAHWYSREDGHEYSMTRYDDLRFLQLMPNLRDLTLARIDAGRLPQLSELAKLDNLMLADSNIPDLDWVEGAAIKKIDLLNSTGSLTDFSVLTGCEKLREVHLDLINTRQADLSGFAPERLDWFWLNNGYDLQNTLDLSGMRGCSALHEVQLDYVPVTDLSFLDSAPMLNRLRLQGLDRLRDLSALSGLGNLRELEIEDCAQLRDYSPIAGCAMLEQFRFNAGESNNRLRDASFLNGLTKLGDVQLGGVDLANLDFLKELSQYRSVMEHFSFWGTIGDYSGLAAMKTYRSLSLDPDDGVRLEEILPWLEDATIQDLALRRFAEVDFSALPKITQSLELDRCGITDLSTMPEAFPALNLAFNKCSALRSLDGLQNHARFGKNRNGELNIYYCPRLNDWSALDGMSLNKLSICGGYSLPDFSTLKTGELSLDSVADVTDLDFLNEMDSTSSCNFKLVGLEGLNNLKPLERFLGSWLAVSPQLAEQAQDLVNAGRFREFRIEYPEGGWEEDDIEMALLSLDELETLPPAMLRHVTRLCLVGDQVVDLSDADIWEDWSGGRDEPALILHRWATDEETPIKSGKGIVTDLSLFRELTGLRELRLYCQPLTSLDGIQQFPELRDLQVRFCQELKDVSPAFTLQNLRYLSLNGCPVESIQGVQNLYSLCGLDLNNTKVTDLSPLAGCDFSTAVREWGGFELHLNGISPEDYSALAAIPAFNNLDINDVDPVRYLSFLEGRQVFRYFACNAFVDWSEAEDPNALFTDFVRAHPELKELGIPWNPGITDLTPLLELENLERVRVSHNMPEAIDSLGGQELPFVWEVEGQ